jgi:HlyD family secretion protein
VITDVYKNPAEMLVPGTPLIRIIATKDTYTYFYVPAPILSSLSIGMEVEGILPELPNKKFLGRISKINEEAEFTPKNVQTRSERTRLVYGVKVYFDNSEGILKAGMPIESLLIKK